MDLAQSTDRSRLYVPEIHDIHPGMERELERMHDVLPAAARAVAALLVVPNWQGRAPISQGFAQSLSGLGGERVLHGWTHSLGADFMNWLLYGHDNRSEFARLDRAAARERIGRGVDAFADAFGGRPRWFCAPRWQQSPVVADVLLESGFEAYMVRNRLSSFSLGAVDLPALCFDEGDRKLRNSIMHRLRRRTIAMLLRRGEPFRVTLHPADVRDPEAWAQVTELFAALEAGGWRPVSPDRMLALAASREAAGA